MKIDKNRQFAINTSGSTWVFSSTDPGVSFSNLTGTTTATNQVITTDITYESDTVFSNATILLEVTDPSGCKTTHTVTKVDPCSAFTLGTVSVSKSGTTFSAAIAVSGGSGDYNYIWDITPLIPTTIPPVVSNDPNIEFEIPANTPSGEILIRVTVEDNVRGCTKSSEITTAFHNPIVVPDITLGLTCIEGAPDFLAIRNLVFDKTAYNSVFTKNGNTVDWSTLTVTKPSSAFDVKIGFPYMPTEQGIVIKMLTQVPTGDYEFTYYVKDTLGLASNIGTLTVKVSDCLGDTNVPGEGLPNTGGLIERLDTSASPSDTIAFPADTRFADNVDIDWTTFTVHNNPTYGTVALNAEREIIYTITSVNTIADFFEWSVKDINGISSGRIVDVVHHNVIAVPTTSALALHETIGEASDAKDLSAQFTGEIDKGSIYISTTNEHIQVSQDSNYDFIFTPLPGATATETVKFKGANLAGEYSAEETITINCVYAGDLPISTYNITCKSKTFNLIDLFDNVVGSYTITETTPVTEGDSSNDDYTTQGGSITSPTGVASVNFAAINPGTYRFTLTATSSGESDTKEVIVTFATAPSIAFDVITDNTDGTFDATFSANGILPSTIAVTVQGSPAVFLSGIQYDSTTGTGSFTAQYVVVPGNNEINLSATSECGTIVRDIQTDTAT